MSTSKLVQLSFAGIAFPYQQITVSGSIREHVHEYPHSPGGAPEKLGRKLYEFDIDTALQDNFIVPKYKNSWPHDLNKLVALFEQQKTEDLVIPQIGGAVRAYCVNWKRVLSSRNTSGEAVTLKFREDSEALRLIQSQFQTATQGLSSARSALDSEIRAAPTLKVGLLDTILRAVDDILAYKDQFDMWTMLIEAKCLSCLAMLRNVMNTSQELQNLDNLRVVNALQNLWTEVRGIYNDMQQKGLTSKWYTTKADHLSLSQVSIAIFGVSNRGGELLSLNSLTDPFDIPLRTKIRYYADAA